ncbi:MAG: periplasmic heavy metal sensor [Bacteroidales bacterium]|nr:periplasmic heavy metal sensor [Bacteroidales bacterium]
METKPKNRLLFWLLIFLIAVNLGALATYFFFPAKQQNLSCAGTDAHPGCYYRNQLDLSDGQAVQVEQLSENYLKASGEMAEKIKSLRGEILNELSMDDPDSLRLDQLLTELINMQGQLQRENMKHYLTLKEICTPEQALRLSRLYHELYGCPMQQGNSMHNRQRQGN